MIPLLPPLRQPAASPASTTSTEQINQLAQQAQPFVQPQRRPSNFLPLAPATSDSYPRQRPRQMSESQIIKPLQLTAGPPVEESMPLSPAQSQQQLSEAVAVKTRRTSSMSSDGSSSGRSARLRYLKLGPVHWGEHQDESQADWHEIEADENAVA